MGIVVVAGKNDLGTTHPALCEQWDYKKNTTLSIHAISKGSGKRAWWICELNHSYEAIVSNRVKGSGCPVCSGKLAVKGVNDIATTNPNLASEISAKNDDLSLSNKITSGSNRKIWWICQSGHEWETSPNLRRNGQNGCPVCSNRKVIPGSNDLKTIRPGLAQEFDLKKNFPKTPAEVPSNSNAKYWWQCESAHSWAATLSNRVKGTGCPYCSGRKSLLGVSDLETVNPALADEWHPTLNHGLDPKQFKGKSHKKVWWLCKRQHSYQAFIDQRTVGNGCPVCSGHEVQRGVNDLATTHPALALEISAETSQENLANQITSGSGKRVVWSCSKGHKWTATVHKRTNGSGCPVCSNLVVISGFNDMATTHPELIAEFDFDRNESITPNKIIAGTNKKVWWVCNTGHSWSASGSSRIQGRGCPSCALRGYRPSLAGILYFIENTSLNAKKVGITNKDSRTDRLRAFKLSGWTTIKTFSDDDGQLIANVERELIRWIRRDLGLPIYLESTAMISTGGASETFSGDVDSSLILNKIASVLAAERAKRIHG